MIQPPAALAFLVYLPCFAGLFAGYKKASGSLRRIVVLGVLALIAIGPIPFLGGPTKTSTPASSFLPLLAMAYAWFSIGFGTALSATRYLRLVGIPGYIFAVCSTITALCMAGLTIDMPIEWIKTGDYHHAVILFAGYSSLLLYLAVPIMLFRLGPNTTYRALRAHARRLLKIFTILGVLEAGLDYFQSYAGSRMLWWVPSVEPPLAYDVWFSLIIGLGATLWVSDPSFAAAGWDAEGSSFGDEAGLRISQRRTDASDDDDEEEDLDKEDAAPKSLKTLVQYKIPEGWTKIVSFPGSAAECGTSLQIRPVGLVARVVRARLQLKIVVWPEAMTARGCTLESEARENLAVWGATPLRSTKSTRHGFESYECEYSTPHDCGYLVLFISSGYIFIFIWTTSSVDMYQRYFEAVNKFIDDCQVHPPSTNDKEFA